MVILEKIYIFFKSDCGSFDIAMIPMYNKPRFAIIGKGPRDPWIKKVLYMSLRN